MLTDESVLLDLKHLLMEAKQKVPQFLASMQADSEIYLDVGGQCVCFVCVCVRVCVICVCACGLCVCACTCVSQHCEVVGGAIVTGVYPCFQEKWGALTVVVWVTASPTVPSWKPSRQSRQPTSADEITWHTMQQTGRRTVPYREDPQRCVSSEGTGWQSADSAFYPAVVDVSAVRIQTGRSADNSCYPTVGDVSAARIQTGRSAETVHVILLVGICSDALSAKDFNDKGAW